MHACIRFPVVLACAAVLVACGGSDSDDATRKSSPAPADPIEQFEVSEAGDGTRSVVGRPVRATKDGIVIANADGDELEFDVRPTDAASVDVAHVSSHVGIQDLAFRLYFDDVDGTLYAIASEEVSATEL